jgi:hypothetical protein
MTGNVIGDPPSSDNIEPGPGEAISLDNTIDEIARKALEEARRVEELLKLRRQSAGE